MLRNEHGFTLIEVIGVLVILSIVVAVGITVAIRNTETVERRTIEISISTLNEMEHQAWLNVKLDGWQSDDDVLKQIEPHLKNTNNFKRIPSTIDQPGRWEVQK